MAASASDVLAAHIVVKDGTEREAKILQQGNGEVFVRYTGPDQGLSEWVSTEHVRPAKRRRTSTRVASIVGADDGRSSNSPAPKSINGPIVRPRRVGPRRQPSPSSDSDIEIVSIGPKPGESSAPPTSGGSGVVKSDVAQELSSNEIPTAQLPEPTTAELPQPNGHNEQTPPAGAGEQNSEAKMTEEEFDIAHHKQITSRRNFDKVNFGQWQIKTWYFSPYPLSEAEPEPAPPIADTRIPGVARTTARSHGRTSDLLAGGLGRDYAEKSILWVCDRCFKYMAEGIVWEAHVRKCARKNPPGKKVYQRGAHTIWEVDGAKEKLYCQNLSLFGKLFIDVKTLFFDCDNFLFYLLTDADSQRDHVLGFFSKEKVSYDDYNLACIIVLPPYQRKGYGMLMIEFSYELSRRAGRVGTPERPLSDLGLRSYLTYWISTILRYLKHMLSVMPPELSSVTTLNSIPDFNRLRTSSSDVESFTSVARKRRKTKGWDGEAHALFAPPPPPVDASHTLQRTLETHPNPDGSATTHAVIRCSMAEIARATNLRVEDAAFALSECGLLSIRDGEATVVITRLAVEKAASERRLKRMCMEVQHVLLP